jgi:benzaldehyde dehydrogenase (NAD)
MTTEVETERLWQVDERTTFIGGRWEAGEGDEIVVADKSSDEPLVVIREASEAQVERAVAAAKAAQPAWAALPAAERAAVLRRAADLLQAHHDEVVTWIVRESGSARGKAHAAEYLQALDEFREAADLAESVAPRSLPVQDEDASVAVRVPYGVVGVITPWNVPFTLAMRSVAPALALGNAVVIKPDHQTPVSGAVLIGRLLQEAGIPAGVYSAVPGQGPSVGATLVSHPDVSMVSFTGSTAVGRTIAVAAAPQLKKVALELGGKSPHVVLDDADVAGAAAAGAWGNFTHQGQVCMAVGRHIVQEGVLDDYVAELASWARGLRVGDPYLEDVDLGPLINSRQAERVEAIVADAVAKGAEVVAGGHRDGNFVAPTVLKGVTPEMRAYSEELFGPVAVVVAATDDEDAVRIANDSEYGLSGSVHSGSIERANGVADRIVSGMVHINGQPINDNAWAPMGGTKASGTGGRFGGEANVDMFTYLRWRTTRSTADRGHFAKRDTES